MFTATIEAGRRLAARLSRQYDINAVPAHERLFTSEISGWDRAAEAQVVRAFGQESTEHARWRQLAGSHAERMMAHSGRDTWNEAQEAITNISECLGLLTEFGLLAKVPPEYERSSNSTERQDTVMTTPAIQLFISHSSADAIVAAALIDLLRSALNLPAMAIRCTSVDGYRLPGGADTNAQLRREVHDAVAFVGIVSPSSAQSSYVLFELGARWGAGRHLVPLLAPGAPASLLAGPLAALNALRCDKPAQLHQLVAEIGGKLGVTLERADAYQVHIDRLASTRSAEPEQPAEASARSGPPARSLNLDERDALADLPTEARELLSEAAKDRNGSVLVARSMQGTSVSTNAKQFCEPGNARSEARVRAAIQQLLERGLLENQGDGSVLTVTDEGFRIADLLERLG